MARPPRRDVRRPVIGVTGNSRRFSPSWLCTRAAVRLAGGTAVRIMVTRRVPVERLDGLIISGGDDIHPTLFGAEPTVETFYDVARDSLEQDYIAHGLKAGMPILGICRGHQLINVTLGGTLHQDIRRMRRRTLNRRGLLPTKTVHVEPGSRLFAIVGTDRLRVNSLHFQAVDSLAPRLACEGRDLDGFCQALGYDGGDVLGVQWHPEYLFYLPAQLRLFRWLIRAAAGARHLLQHEING